MRLVFVVVFLLAGCTSQNPLSGLITQVEAIEIPDMAPPAARAYRATLTRNARVIWGLDAPVPMFGAQVEQESGWNTHAVSPAGAIGLAQFIPSTSDWIDDAYPDLGTAQPANPEWALRAMVRYDRHLYENVSGSATDCDRDAFMLAGYNGGEKWVQRDRALAGQTGHDSSRYWGQVEAVNAGRTSAAWHENRGYPQRILRVLQPKYSVWGASVCTELS